MKVAIYIRTSTDDQNPENQLKDCLDINNYGEYEIIEDKVSGWKELDRKGFDKLKTLVMGGKIEHIIVWDLDRLYRNRKKLIGFFNLCQMKRVHIHSYRQEWLEQLNTIPSPFNEIMHNLMLQIMGWIAEEESNKRSERVKSAQRVKEGVTYSYKGNKWGRKSLSAQKRNKIIEMKDLSIRTIAQNVGCSVGVVHKVLKEFEEQKKELNMSSSSSQ